MLFLVFFQNEVGGRAGDALDGGQPLADEQGHLPQGAAGDDDGQVEGTAHEIHALYLVILIDALGDAVKAVGGLGDHVHLDQGGDGLLVDPVPVDDGLIAQNDPLFLIFVNGCLHVCLRHPRDGCQLLCGHGTILLQQLQQLIHVDSSVLI